MFKFNIKVTSNGELKKSYGFNNKSQFDSKVRDLIDSGSKLVRKAEYTAILTT